MIWLDKLERRLGFLAIPGLYRILVGFAALVFALAWALPGFTSMLVLDPEKSATARFGGLSQTFLSRKR